MPINIPLRKNRVCMRLVLVMLNDVQLIYIIKQRFFSFNYLYNYNFLSLVWFQGSCILVWTFDYKEDYFLYFADGSEGEGIGCCGVILMALSWLLIIITFPFSLCLCIKVRSISRVFHGRTESVCMQIYAKIVDFFYCYWKKIEISWNVMMWCKLWQIWNFAVYSSFKSLGKNLNLIWACNSLYFPYSSYYGIFGWIIFRPVSLTPLLTNIFSLNHKNLYYFYMLVNSVLILKNSSSLLVRHVYDRKVKRNSRSS